MSGAEQQFLQKLDQSLGKCPNKQEILVEYQAHVQEITKECAAASNQYERIVKRLGSPKEIALMWRQELTITPRKMQWLFVLFNIGLFVGGGLLTIGYNVYEWNWVELIWVTLTNIPAIIIFIYLFFWGLLGYEIGKEFGPRGRKLLKKTFLLCIVPNLVLMNLTVFRLIPHEWFQPLLSIPFIVICIAFTGVLYPISLLGYRWGKRASI